MSRPCLVPNYVKWPKWTNYCNHYDPAPEDGACMFSSIPRGSCSYDSTITMEKVAKVVRNADKLKALQDDVRMIRDD